VEESSGALMEDDSLDWYSTTQYVGWHVTYSRCSLEDASYTATCPSWESVVRPGGVVKGRFTAVSRETAHVSIRSLVSPLHPC